MGCCFSQEYVYYVVLQHDQFIGITSDLKEAEVIFMDQGNALDVELLKISTKRVGGVIVRQPIVYYYTRGFI